MKNLQRNALFLAASLVCASAMAQGYMGVSAGQSKVDIDCSGTITCDDSDNAFKIFGGYMFTPNFGLEGAYYNQGTIKQTASDPQLGNVSAEFKGDGFGLYGIGVLPFDKWSLFAKLGLVSTKIKLDATSSIAGSVSASERNTNFGWAIGAGYEFTKNVGARLEFERTRVEFQGEKNDVDLITLGVLYRF